MTGLALHMNGKSSRDILVTPTQIRLVQSGFGSILDQARHVADDFYANLFRMDPSLRSLFAQDMRAQKRAFISVLALAIDSLDKIENLKPAIVELGRRHANYGIKPAHYDTAGNALMTTVGELMGKYWTDEMEEAWMAGYVMLAGIMKDAATEAEGHRLDA